MLKEHPLDLIDPTGDELGIFAEEILAEEQQHPACCSACISTLACAKCASTVSSISSNCCLEV